MSDFQVEDKMPEKAFQELARDKNLTSIEWEFLRRYYGLPHNEELVNTIGLHCQERHVMMAQAKIRRNSQSRCPIG